jgi:hypothetical protein
MLPGRVAVQTGESMSRRRRREVQAAKPRRGAEAAFAVVTMIALAITVYLANRADAMTVEEHTLARALPCVSQGSGTDNRDCVEDVAGVAVGTPWQSTRSLVTKLEVSSRGKLVTLNVPHEVGAAFKQIQDGDFVSLTTWRGDIVAVTAQGDTESTSTALAEQYRSRLVVTFLAAGFTVILAGLTLISVVQTEEFFANQRGRLGNVAAGVVLFGGVAIAASSAAIMQGGGLRGALLTAPIIFVTGLGVAGGATVWSLVRRRREVDRFIRQMAG